MISRYDFIWPKIYSILIITTAFAAGIWWQSYDYSLHITILISVAIFSVGVFYAFKRNKCAIVIIALASSIAFGAGSFRYYMLINKQQKLHEITNHKMFTIVGTITDYRKTGKAYPSHRMIVHLHQIENKNERIEVDAPILIFCPRIKGISISDKIMIHDASFVHKYSPSFNFYLLKEEVFGSLFLHNPKIQKIVRPKISIARTLFYLRKNIATRCKEKLDPKTYLYFSSIFLGDPETKKLIDPIKHQLQRWGLIHYLARAGLHVVIFIALWQFMLRLLPLRFAIKQMILILICLIYALLSWPSIPFQRAFLSFIITRGCILLRWKVYYIPVLMIIMLATLVGNPIYLFSLDFQLSFGVTFALAWFNEIQSNYYS